ncbi:hypothetical protein GCM10011584_00890 [Nocardioides phosphati]|uniref:PKD domain-containing protein n=1 Tax=Nocardioides phosphati TaxID=1867775 RepID=A0ABQ2N726_9ACTN|nr:hypothetical protein [Nocardioides phosphati]GGO84110.1 hypothetical protein GCM10011584_00890 [Nocardioides phosphati]
MSRQLGARLASTALALIVCVVGGGAASATHDGTDVSPAPNGFAVLQEVNHGGQKTPGAPPHRGGSKSEVASAPWTLTCETGHLLDCIDAPMCKQANGEVLIFWDGSVHPGLGAVQACPQSAKNGVDIGALVLRAFRRVPLPAPALSIQPPNGKTLVGLETIFSTQAEPFTKTLTLLGRKVTLKIEPSSFVWHHGDGTSQTTDWAGKAWDHDSPDIDGYLTHVYEHTGAVRPSVEVTWSAQFRVGGGAWRPVNGTVTRTGAPVPLQILEGQPVLNSY